MIVSGPAGSGKTTLAHALAAAVGCPAICRDEIKEGMVQAAPDFVAGPGDELTRRTFPVFFGVLELLLRAGVTTVAEAAFQDPAWRRGLAPFLDVARLRIVHCVVAAEVAVQRSLRRNAGSPLRAAHADLGPGDAAEAARRHRAFDRISLGAQSPGAQSPGAQSPGAQALEVDTTDGYRPGLGEIVAFVSGR